MSTDWEDKFEAMVREYKEILAEEKRREEMNQ